LAGVSANSAIRKPKKKAEQNTVWKNDPKFEYTQPIMLQ
jgi:hypothetical protein